MTPHIRSGRLRLLAVCDQKRAPAFPDTPTMVESGFPGVISIGWGGLVAPTGTPQDIIQKTQREVARGLAAADVKERLSGMGADPVGSTPEEFGAFIRSEHEKWARVVTGTNL